MMAKPRLHPFLSALTLTAFITGAAYAQVAKQGNDTLSSLAFTHERLA
jgi:hypothetical protein